MSEVNVMTYTIQRRQVARPMFSLPTGRYKTHLDVDVTNQAGGVTVRLTVDGSTPSEHSPILESIIAITSEGTVTLKARAFAPQMLASEVAVANYTVDLIPPSLPYNPGISAWATLIQPRYFSRWVNVVTTQLRPPTDKYSFSSFNAGSQG